MNQILNSISIRAKIIGNSIILLLMIVAGLGYSWFSMNQIGNELEAIAEQGIPLTRNLSKITQHQLEQAIHFERALRYGELIGREENAAEQLDAEIKAFDQLSKMVDEEIKTGELMVEADLVNAHSQLEAEEFARIDLALKNIETEHTDFEQHAHQVFNLLKQGNVHEAEVLAVKVEHEEDQLNAELESLLLEVELFTADAALRAEEHEHSAIKMLSLLALGSLLFGGIISGLVARNIIRRLEETANSMARIASGDLSQSVMVHGKDEFGKLQQPMQAMQSRFLEMISKIGATASQLSTTVEEVSTVMQQTSSNIQQQQVETEQVSTAMNEMSIAIKEVSNSVAGTSNAANGANVETDKGQKIVQDAVDGIQQLAIQIDSTADIIGKVEQDSENINTVLDVIKGIADQTNLLALNAAIEAARAGEQGRGFAVVADEVRTLAGRTQESTAEINHIIDQLQLGARKAVQAMTQSREQSNTVVEKAKLAGSSLNTIATSVAQIDDMSTQIATAAEEQNAVAESMNNNIKQIRDMAVDNSASVHQTTQTGGNLARLAAELQGLIDEFRVDQEVDTLEVN